MLGGSSGFDAMFGLVSAIIVISIVAIVGTAIYRFFAAKRAGFDPLAGDIQMMQKARDSQLLAAGRGVEERLAEVDALLAAGTISADEHKVARDRIIGSL